MSDAPQLPTASPTGALWFGVRVGLTSVFTFVIAFTYVGFGALAHDYGFSVGWAMLSTALQWAGPAQVVLVTGLGAGTSLIEIAVAVSLSSVRLLPIVVALLPMVKPARAEALAIAHAGAFHGGQRLGRDHAARPRPAARASRRVLQWLRRDAAGVGVAFTAVGYYLQALLPAVFGAAAMFITPISFLTSSARNARLLLEKAALGIGLIVGPVLAFSDVEFDLLWTGIIGGTLAYGLHRLHRSWSAPA